MHQRCCNNFDKAKDRRVQLAPLYQSCRAAFIVLLAAIRTVASMRLSCLNSIAERCHCERQPLHGGAWIAG
jgi:hypothetical protein